MLKVYETKQVECRKCGWVGKVFKNIPLKYAWCGGCRSEGLRLYKSAPNKASTRLSEGGTKSAIKRVRNANRSADAPPEVVMETTLDLKMIGMYSINKVAPDKVNCSNCGNADWGDVLIEGICGRCLHQAWQAAQQSVHPTIESGREIPAEVVKSESVLPANSG